MFQRPACFPKKADLKKEIRAGITTFLTMSYIIFVNPLILSEAGIPYDGAIFATCIASAVATLIMGLYAGYPFALAPGMGLNAYFTYGVVKGMGYSWQTALGAVFIEGLLFIFFTILGLRRRLISSIPESIRIATPVGIGLFIAFIGMKNAGFIKASPDTFVTLGDLSKEGPLLSFIGLIISSFLIAKDIKGAIFLGIISVTALSAISGYVSFPERIFSFPKPSSFLKLDLSGIGEIFFWKAVLAFLFVDMFDTIGSITALGELGGFSKDGVLERMDQALMSDAIGTTVGALLGTSTVTTYIESSTGIAEGGRTGITAIVVSFLFLLSCFFSPLVKIVPKEATAPALILVGLFMCSRAKDIPWDDITEAFPAFLTLFLMPFTYSIANGLAAGFICYPVLKLLTGRWKEVPLSLWFISFLFFIHFL